MESKRYPMCGFPIAHMDKFLEKLVREHNRFVAICEETKHYDKSGNLQRISRKVTRVVTPGESGHSLPLLLCCQEESLPTSLKLVLWYNPLVQEPSLTKRLSRSSPTTTSWPSTGPVSATVGQPLRINPGSSWHGSIHRRASSLRRARRPRVARSPRTLRVSHQRRLCFLPPCLL